MRARTLLYLEFTNLEIDALMRDLSRTENGLQLLIDEGAIKERDAIPLGVLYKSAFRDPRHVRADKIAAAIRVLMTQRTWFQRDIERPFNDLLRQEHGGNLKEKADLALDVLHKGRSGMIEALDRVLVILRCGLNGMRLAEEMADPATQEDPGSAAQAPPTFEEVARPAGDDATFGMDKETLEKINRAALRAGESQQPCA